jgi:hypothetical protein
MEAKDLTKRLVKSEGRRHGGPWEDPAMLSRYGHLQVDDVREVAKRKHPLSFLRKEKYEAVTQRWFDLSSYITNREERKDISYKRSWTSMEQKKFGL